MKSFIIHIDSLEILESLNNEQAGKLFKAIKKYQEDQTIIEEDQLIKIALIPFVSQFKRDKEKYDNICKRNRENGKNGGRPKTQENPVGYLETQENPKNLKNKSSNKSKSKSDSNSDSNNKLIVQNENHFDEFWEYYTPIEQQGRAVGKGSKQEAKAEYQKQIKKYTHDEIMQGLKNYLTFCEQKGQLTLQAVRFLKRQTFLDEFNIVIKPPTEAEKGDAFINEYLNSIKK